MNKVSSATASVLCHLLRRVTDPAFPLDHDLLKSADWKKVRKLAAVQGVQSIIFDAVSELPADLRPSQAFMMPWIRYVVGQADLYQTFCCDSRSLGFL